jgi:hypothetical protein
MTKFQIKDNNLGDYEKFAQVSRRLYKGVITRLDREGKLFRVETMYADDGATPVKSLTILKGIQ